MSVQDKANATPDTSTPGTATPRTRRVIATTPTYTEAERIVDTLADRQFPVERMTIVGRDLRFVETVTGRVGWGDDLARGAVVGGFTGLLIGWLFGVFDWFAPIVAAGWLAFDGLWFGLVVGLIMGAIVHLLRRGRRDFDSVSTMTADHYDVLVDEDLAERAEKLLAEPAPQQESSRRFARR
jgi:hypothetical protein